MGRSLRCSCVTVHNNFPIQLKLLQLVVQCANIATFFDDDDDDGDDGDDDGDDDDDDDDIR